MVYCLTWHGTVVREQGASGRLIHVLAVPVRSTAIDWWVDEVNTGEAAPGEAPLGDATQAASAIYVQRDGAYLCADPMTGVAQFDRDAVGIWETFLPLTKDDLARLRRLLGWYWSENEAGPGERPVLRENFKLCVGTCEMDLRHGVPVPDVAAVRFTDAVSGRSFRAMEPVAAAQGAECKLRRLPFDQQAPLVANAAAFAATPNSRMNITGDREYGFLPLAACRSDQDWMQERLSQGGTRALGPQTLYCQAVRENDKYVLLTRGQEGLLFNKDGASNETGYLLSSIAPNANPIIGREGDDFYIAHGMLERAPRLAGPHVVFYGGNLSNYYHWLIDALLPLHALMPYLPRGAKLLIPGSLRQFHDGPAATAGRIVDHMEALREWGFDDLPTVEVADPVCHVEEVYWIDQCFIGQMPARLLRAARDAVLARLPPAQGVASPKRIYLRRRDTRSVANAKLIEKAAANNGFEIYEMEGMSPRAQIELFRDAEFVMGPHGAALANLLFCKPGTKVIEFSPESEFRPYFAQISDKLDLVHGVLPCPTHNGRFDGRMTVDVEKLRMLLRQMLFMLQSA